MSKDMQKKVERDTVIYENSEARWVFSQGRPPHIDDYQVAISAVDKNINIPVMIVMSGREFRSMLRDMGIKTLTDPRDGIVYRGAPLEPDDLTELKSGKSDLTDTPRCETIQNVK